MNTYRLRAAAALLAPLAAACLLAACPSVPTGTWNDKVAAALRLDTDALRASTQALQAGAISPERDREIRRVTDAAFSAIQAASALHGTDPAAAEVQLAAALAQVIAMQEQAKGGAK